MDRKNDLFQKLKPPCIALSQAAMALNGPRGNLKTVTEHLEAIKGVLSNRAAVSHALDAKLAEYVFFPISQVLKASQKVSILCLELCLQCIAYLIDQGWRQNIPRQLAAQMVILCTLLGERQPQGLSFSESTDELRASAFWCLFHIFSVVGIDSDTRTLLTGDSNFPQLGQTISVLLDGIQDAGSGDAQVAATSALNSLINNVTDAEIRANFLPGIMSKLTKILTPSTSVRRNHKVLIGCLQILEVLVRSTMSDARPDNTTSGDKAQLRASNKNATKSVMDEGWKKAAAERIKPAMINILRLKTHGRNDVKEAVASLCLTILQHSRKTLANCSSVAVETLIFISTSTPNSISRAQLEVLTSVNPSIATLLQGLLYEWLQSLTTTMQGADEHAKTTKLQHIATAYGILVQGGVDTRVIDRILASTLKDSVVIELNLPGLKQQPQLSGSQIQSLDLTIAREDQDMTGFSSPLVKYKAQQDSLTEVERFTQFISSSTSSPAFMADLARSLRQAQGDEQIASLYLLLTAIQTAIQKKDALNDLMDIEDDAHTTYDDYLEEVYSFALSVLNNSSDVEVDSRLQSLALRSLALRAQITGKEFRYELLDALYPVLHTLATPDVQLQQDSITVLKAFTSACGYNSVKDLIVENVDYLTNAVALKMNAFDISPQAPQVLLMMVRLAGPSLLPYLEDTIESIFAALEDYHGYPLLVELLFKVLGVMAEEGVKAPQLSIMGGNETGGASTRLDRWQGSSVHDLATLLRDRAEDEWESSKIPSTSPPPSHPKEPWKGIGSASSEDEDMTEIDKHRDTQMDDAEQPPPAAKTYNLVFKISELTQHFLPSASPTLRTSLLSLLRTTVPAIARHENSFLPLINTLWPEVASRLDDEEPHIVASALGVVQVLCEFAGDFMRTRVTQLWPTMREIYDTTVKDIVHSNSSRGVISDGVTNKSLAPYKRQLEVAVSRMQEAANTYGDTSTRLLWAALVDTLSTIVQYVQIAPDMFDEALEMLEPALNDSGVRLGLEQENADAVWLARMRSGSIPKPQMPQPPANVTWQFAEVPG